MIKIPGYYIQREIGQGGMARVYLGIQQSLEREVAIKVLSTDLVSDPEFCERFLKEGKTLAKVSHPNIVQIYDCGEHDGDYYMCMQFVSGGTLEDRLDQGRLPLNESIQILRQVASALDCSHGKNVVHRDVKPGNVLFRDDGTLALSDFGIAKSTRQDATQMTAVGMAIGTPAYMSPEQASAQEITPKSDQYSLGVVFYEMLTGSVPYSAGTAIAVAIQHLQAPIPSLPIELNHLQPIIDRVMAKNPDERFDTLEELIVTLDKVRVDTSIGQKTEVIGPGHEVELAAPTQPKRKRILPISAGIVGAGIVLGTLYFFQGGTDPTPTPTPIPTPVVLDIATQREVMKWLDIAETHRSIGRLVEPPGGNALEAYRKVLELDATNADALQGIGNIAASYEALAQERLSEGDIDESKLLVAQGLAADPENSELKQLKKQLDSR